MAAKTEGWKIDFLRLTYPSENTQEISKILNSKRTTIGALCQCYNIKKPSKTNLVGEKFGKLLVISKYDGNKNYKETMWNCVCDCGKETLVSRWSLLRRGTVSCGCLRLEVIDNGCENIPGWYYGQIEKSAKYRNIPFEITIEELNELWKKQQGRCALTNIPLEFYRHNIRITKAESTASLDRIDSWKSYTINNVQWIHKDVNIMKSSYSESYFLLICNLISGIKKIEDVDLEKVQANRKYNRKVFYDAESS